MNQTFFFIKQFFRTPKSVGSLTPSSKALAESITNDLGKGNQTPLVVELGPGSGAITKKIIEKLPNLLCYIGIEVNEAFREHLRKHFEGILIIDGSARDIEEHLALVQGKVDVIISGLPFTNIPDEKTLRILNGAEKVLKEGGEFRLFLYLHTLYLPKNRRLLAMAQKIFKSKTQKLVLRNFPPAVIFTFVKTSSA